MNKSELQRFAKNERDRFGFVPSRNDRVDADRSRFRRGHDIGRRDVLAHARRSAARAAARRARGIRKGLHET